MASFILSSICAQICFLLNSHLFQIDSCMRVCITHEDDILPVLIPRQHPSIAFHAAIWFTSRSSWKVWIQTIVRGWVDLWHLIPLMVSFCQWQTQSYILLSHLFFSLIPLAYVRYSGAYCVPVHTLKSIYTNLATYPFVTLCLV